MGLAAATLAQLVLGGCLFWLGRWGRLGADRLVPPRLESAEHRRRADAVARGGLLCQGVGLLLTLFALLIPIAALT